MKINEIADTEAAELAEYIKKNCQPFLEQINNQIMDYRMFRGTFKQIEEWNVFPVRQDRRSRDIPSATNDRLIKAFAKNGFKANRNNSVFCSGNTDVIYNYGSSAVCVFPIGEFSFTWSDPIDDLYIHMDAMEYFDKSDYTDYIKKYYQDTDLKAAIKSKSEIMVACKEVLLVDMKFLGTVYT